MQLPNPSLSKISTGQNYRAEMIIFALVVPSDLNLKRVFQSLAGFFLSQQRLSSGRLTLLAALAPISASGLRNESTFISFDYLGSTCPSGIQFFFFFLRFLCIEMSSVALKIMIVWFM